MNVHNESNKTTEPDVDLYLLIKIAGPYHSNTLANLHFTGVCVCVCEMKRTACDCVSCHITIPFAGWMVKESMK